eukprot:Skav232140  [mRNA]  locus=scaffold1744:240959:242452:- [translate_table: standard]
MVIREGEDVQIEAIKLCFAPPEARSRSAVGARIAQTLMDLSDDEESWQQVRNFLQDHQFSNVNAAKTTWWGFDRTYPLHVAAKEGNMKIMQLLTKFGADPKQRDGHGKVAIAYAVRPVPRRSSSQSSTDLPMDEGRHEVAGRL